MFKTTTPVAGTLSIMAPIIGTLARVWRTFIPIAVIALGPLVARDANAQAEAWTTYQYFDASKYVEGLCNYERSLSASDGAGNLAVTGSASSYYSELIVAKFGASTGSMEWSRVYAGAGGGNSCGTAVAFDGAGNIFAAGYFGKPNNGRDAVVLKLNGANGDIIWSKLIEDGGPFNDIAVDSLGNAVATGQLGTLKLNANTGAVLWSSTGPFAIGQQVLVDTSGDAYVRSYGNVTKIAGASGFQSWVYVSYPTNTYYGGIVLDGHGYVVYARAPAYGNDPALATKIDATTGAISWESSIGAFWFIGQPSSDDEGNIYVAGTEVGSGTDILRTVRLSGATGTIDWSVSLGGEMAGSYFGDSTSIDSSGNVVVLGKKMVTQQPNGARDYGLHALRLSSSSGATLWSRLVGGTGPDNLDRTSPPFATADGAIRIAGAFYDSYGHRPQSRALKLDGQFGNVVSNQAVNHFVDGTEAFDIAVDANGNVYSLGRETGRDSSFAVRVTKLLASGVEAWTIRLQAELYPERLRIVVSPSGNPILYRGDLFAMVPNQQVLSLSAETGSVLWNQSVSAPANGGIDDISVGPDGSFFLLLSGGGEYAVAKHSVADGHEIWRKQFPVVNGSYPYPKFAIGGDGAVHVSGFELQANYPSVARASKLNPSTGATMWTVTFPSEPAYSAFVAPGAGGEMYLSVRSLPQRMLYKLAASDGSEVWRQSTTDFGPVFLDATGNVIQIANSTRWASKYSPITGSLIWSAPLIDTGNFQAEPLTLPPFLDSNGNFFVSSMAYEAFPKLTVTKVSVADGQVAWQHIGPATNASINYRLGTAVLGTNGTIFMTAMGKEDWMPLAGYVRKLVDQGFSGAPTSKLLGIQIAGAPGKVVSAPVGIDCLYARCVKSFPIGTLVTLTPVPDGTSQFTGWSGGGCVGTGNCTISLGASTIVTAEFAPRAFTLEVVKTGNGTGRVISAPSGIDCGGACVSAFVASANIVLTPTADAGSLLVASRVSCAGLQDATIQACVNTGASNVTVTYEFVSGDITIGIFQNPFPYLGNGRIVSTPPGIDCPNGGRCAYKFPAGTNVTLSASTTTDQDFLTWGLPSGMQCANPTATTCTLSASATLQPQFRYKPTTVTVIKTGGGSGTVRTRNSPGVDCGATCVGTVASIGGSLDALDALPDAGSVFVGFSGCKSVFPASS